MTPVTIQTKSITTLNRMTHTLPCNLNLSHVDILTSELNTLAKDNTSQETRRTSSVSLKGKVEQRQKHPLNSTHSQPVLARMTAITTNTSSARVTWRKIHQAGPTN